VLADFIKCQRKGSYQEKDRKKTALYNGKGGHFLDELNP
jgi:hypothetical protein